MKTGIAAVEVPDTSELHREVAASYFHDCYEVLVDTEAKSAMELYLAVVSRTPEWVNALMALRNRVVSLVGLKNLGHLGAFDSSKPASTYRVGDRVGIFSLLYITDNEIVLGDSDKHLNVKVSIYRLANGERKSVAVSTVVHVHNALGKVYMFFVAPVHRLIAPAMLKRGGASFR
jgi:Protein of unknown function (DUF2867)